MTRFPLSGALGAAACLAFVTGASAHVTFSVREAAQNAAYRGVLQVGHGCQGSPTREIRVTIPEGMIAVHPMPKPGWTLTTTRGPYGREYPYFGRTMNEGVKEILWSGGSLPDEFYDEFIFVGRVTDAFEPGASVHVPVVQTCETGQHAWTAIPVAGAERPKEPAPAFRIVQAAAPAAPAASPPSLIRAGALVIERPWARATPAGAKVAGGYLKVTNTGREPDRLVGTSIAAAGRGEVHEMSVTDGVMRMREVAGGIPIAPGATVTLAPGGLHLMFLDLRAGLKEGEPVRGTLVFEKAGTVEVTFAVGAIGSQAPGGGGHQH